MMMGPYGAGAAALGTGISMYGDYMSDQAMNNSLARSLGTLGGYASQGQDVFNKSAQQSGVKPANQQIQQGQQQFGAAMNANQMPWLNQPHSGMASQLAGIGQGAQNRTAAGNQGLMQGYQNYGFQQHLKDMNANMQLGQNNYMSQNAQVPMLAQMQQSGQQGQNVAAIGSLLQSLGGAAGSIPSTGGSNQGGGQSMMGASPQASPMWLGMAAPQPQQQTPMGGYSAVSPQQMNSLAGGYGPYNTPFAMSQQQLPQFNLY